MAWIWCALCVLPGCGEVRTGDGTADAAGSDASQVVFDADDVAGDADMAGHAGCVRETDEMFSARLGASCGTLSGYDACGIAREAACGDCTAPERCGGAGTPNTCAAHPSLTGVDGYIRRNDAGQYEVVPAIDGAIDKRSRGERIFRRLLHGCGRL